MLYFFYPYCKARHVIAIMSKRSIEETYNKNSNPEFKYDNSENQLRKKIKLQKVNKNKRRKTKDT